MSLFLAGLGWTVIIVMAVWCVVSVVSALLR
jgi:hypothetical protein